MLKNKIPTIYSFCFFFLLDRISFKKLKKKDNKAQNTAAHSRNTEAARSRYKESIKQSLLSIYTF